MKNNEDPSGLTLTLFSTFDSCEDAAWARGPKEGSGFGIGLCDEALDGDFEFVDRSEHAALEAPVGEFGEEALDGIEQEAEVGVKWKVQRGCFASHFWTFGCLWVA